MVRVLCIVQARLTSSRLRGKVLIPLTCDGKSLIFHVLERLTLAKRLTDIVVAIPDTTENDELAHQLALQKVAYFRGSEEDVLSRFYFCAKERAPHWVVRVTCDNPLVDWTLIDDLIPQMEECEYDYMASISDALGTNVEVMTFSALEKAYWEATLEEDREHVTSYIYRHPELFSVLIRSYDIPLVCRLTVDEKEDLELMRALYDALYQGQPISNEKVYAYLIQHPELLDLNSKVQQKGL